MYLANITTDRETFRITPVNKGGCVIGRIQIDTSLKLSRGGRRMVEIWALIQSL